MLSVPPPPPPKPPDRFQFSVRSILVTTFVVAGSLGVVKSLQFFDPRFSALGADNPKTLITFQILGCLLVGLLVYLCLRASYLTTFFERHFAYRRELATYRQQLLEWTRQTKAERQKEREPAEE